MAQRGARRESKEYDGDERLREVGQLHSTCKAFEQGLRYAVVCGEDGGKGGLTKGNLFSETSSGHRAGEGMDMVNPKRARSGKLRTQPRVSPTFGL